MILERDVVQSRRESAKKKLPGEEDGWIMLAAKASLKKNSITSTSGLDKE